MKGPESARSLEDMRLSEKVKESHEKSRGIYGARRILKDLVDDNECVSRTRVGRLMKQQGLESKGKRKFKATTNSNHGRPVAPNRLDREFMVEQPDTVYAGDITYIQTDEGRLYLAVLIDLYSRAIVGWAMSERMPAQPANDAWVMAIWKRKPLKGLMVHSDRGSQYASDLYQKTIKDQGFIGSMSRKGNCWDNAPSERFFHTLKTELTYHRRYHSSFGVHFYTKNHPNHMNNIENTEVSLKKGFSIIENDIQYFYSRIRFDCIPGNTCIRHK